MKFITKKNLSNKRYKSIIKKIDTPYFIIYNTCEDTFDITYTKK